MYRDAELIVNDYMGLFVELISKLESADDIPALIRWIEERRMAFLPLRMKARAFLYRIEVRSESPLDTFRKGIWGLMKGGLSFVEEGHAHLREYGHGDHTVLDLLYGFSSTPLSANRKLLPRLARRQLECIELAWQDVVTGYAEIKKATNPRRVKVASGAAVHRSSSRDR